MPISGLGRQTPQDPITLPRTSPACQPAGYCQQRALFQSTPPTRHRRVRTKAIPVRHRVPETAHHFRFVEKCTTAWKESVCRTWGFADSEVSTYAAFPCYCSRRDPIRPRRPRNGGLAGREPGPCESHATSGTVCRIFHCFLLSQPVADRPLFSAGPLTLCFS